MACDPLQGMDIIGDESTHRRLRREWVRDVKRLRHMLYVLIAVRGRVRSTIELRVDMGISFPRVGMRMIHNSAPVYRHDLLGGLLGIGGNRIGEILACHAVKCLAAGHSLRLIEIPQQMIERAVFHHQYHDVVKGRQIPLLAGDADQRTGLTSCA
jgi:hypothetical protein